MNDRHSNINDAISKRKWTFARELHYEWNFACVYSNRKFVRMFCLYCTRHIYIYIMALDPYSVHSHPIERETINDIRLTDSLQILYIISDISMIYR